MSIEENKDRNSENKGKRGARPRKTNLGKPENHFHRTGDSDGRPRGKGPFKKPFDKKSGPSRFGDKKSEDWKKSTDKPFGERKSRGEFGSKRNSSDTPKPFQKGDRGKFREDRDSRSFDKNRPSGGGRGRSEFNKSDKPFERGDRSKFREDRNPRAFDKDKKPFKSRTEFRDTQNEPKGDEKPAFKQFGKRPVSDEIIQKSKERQVGLQNPARVGEKSFEKKIPKKIQDKIESNPKDENIRLNRYIANAGLCSRREADELIAAGTIKVNGVVVTEMGYQVEPGDTVKYGKDILSREKMMYVLLNKPKDFITTMDDPEERRTVMELVAGACKERIYPVGRLDRNTTGLLLLTNDGELTAKLTHPSSDIKKIYQAELDKPITEADFETLKAGVELEDGFIQPDELAIVSADAHVVGIKIHSGKNRIVRRMFEHLGYEVTKLDRTTFADLNKKDLPRGTWRFLTEKEIIRLKYMI